MRGRHVAVGLLVLALLAGHWLFWYRPRERTGSPDPGTLPGRVFLGTELEYRLWLPYPHQNLGELEAALGDLEELVSSLGELSGRAAPEIPAFGAAGVPPASELILAADPSGERFVAVARVYPIPAMLARWAGKLAGNPLLAGGTAEVGGRRVEATWSGRNWIVRTDDVTADESVIAERAAGTAALAHVDMAVSHGRIPAGDYRLERQSEDLVFSGGDPAVLTDFAALDREESPLPLVIGQTFPSPGALEGRFLALLPGTESIAGLPGAVAASRGERRWRLPGERVLSLLGKDPPRRRLDGWRLGALEPGSLAAGEDLLELSRRLEGAPPLEVALWIEVRGARRLVDQVIEALEQVPVIGSREARPWRAAGRILTRLDRYQRLTAFVSSRPAALMIHLHRQSETSLSGDPYQRQRH